MEKAATPLDVRAEVVACLRKLGVNCGAGDPRGIDQGRCGPLTIIRFYVDPKRHKEGAQRIAQDILKELGSVTSQHRGTVALSRELPKNGEIMLQFWRRF